MVIKKKGEKTGVNPTPPATEFAPEPTLAPAFTTPNPNLNRNFKKYVKSGGKKKVRVKKLKNVAIKKRGKKKWG